MTSSEIRQSFLDFFKSKQHSIVPSSSLMPDSPNLLFTNAGMNQFVPIFLGQVKCPYSPPRAADTQKCIRAGGKHNDLDDVGLDTYHHTFFEMLGNWSFGDYFKSEAIDWAWELVAGVWKFPKERLYATVYSPDPARGDPSEFDQEAYDFWAAKFSAAGLDPKVHIVYGNKKDNFWMMGETGPCGPCSELHVDLTPRGDTKGALVNKGSADCIEIWNLVFIQFNANPDGTFSPLPARHVDTGMGFERVTSILQCTKGFTDFTGIISNYETDIFRPIFDQLEKLSGKKYTSTLPSSMGSTGDPPVPVGESPTGMVEASVPQKSAGGSTGVPSHSAGQVARATQIQIDIAFRVIADHIRTLSFAIADGIQPGNNDRNYVLRRILRRAVRYGRTLGFHEPFFYKLVDVLADTMGNVFPEIRAKRQQVKDVIQREEEGFNKTLDKGLEIFHGYLEEMRRDRQKPASAGTPAGGVMPGRLAFTLYDTYGFPLDLTQLMAREQHIDVAVDEFEKLMDEQRALARAGQKKEIIGLSHLDASLSATSFIGFEKLKTNARIQDIIQVKGKTAIVLDQSVFYAEMGGQVGDTGTIRTEDSEVKILNTQKVDDVFLHVFDGSQSPGGCGAIGKDMEVEVLVDVERRNAIQRHHTVTHLLHWALHEVVSREAAQKGSFVGPEKLTFDFNSVALTPAQVNAIEKLVNERILENAGVSWLEVPYAEIKQRADVMQFFGDKYGDRVRVVQIGGSARGLNGYSMELCGGTHTRATGEIGLFRIVGEAAVSAGVRRIEAVAGLAAYQKTRQEAELIGGLAGKVNSPVGELEKKIDSLLGQQKELEKQLKAMQHKQAAETARGLLGRAVKTEEAGPQAIVENLGVADGDYLQAVADALKGQFKGVVVLGGAANGAVSLVATVSPEFTGKVQAGKIIQTIAPLVGGKGGGKPDNARGGGKDVTKLAEALSSALNLVKKQG